MLETHYRCERMSSNSIIVQSASEREFQDELRALQNTHCHCEEKKMGLSLSYDDFEAVIVLECRVCHTSETHTLEIDNLRLPRCPSCNGPLPLAGSGFAGPGAWHLRRECCRCNAIVIYHNRE
jgi:hypothetical protein